MTLPLKPLPQHLGEGLGGGRAPGRYDTLIMPAMPGPSGPLARTEAEPMAMAR